MTNTSDKTIAGKIDTSEAACERACKWINAGWGVATVLKANEGVEVTALIRALCAERDEACTGNEILKAKLSALCEAVVVNDSYGVEGSSFQTCLACGAGGAPGIVFEHTTDCAVGRSEEVSERWFKERSDELKEYEDEEKRLLARAEAAESELSSLRAKNDELAQSCTELERRVQADYAASEIADLRAELSELRAKGGAVSEEAIAGQVKIIRDELALQRDCALPCACEQAEYEHSTSCQANARVVLALLQSAPQDARHGERWRHKKRGTTYTIVGNAQVQAEEPLTDYEVVKVYRCEQTGELWVRRLAEFNDGRFERVPPPPEIAKEAQR